MVQVLNLIYFSQKQIEMMYVQEQTWRVRLLSFIDYLLKVL